MDKVKTSPTNRIVNHLAYLYVGFRNCVFLPRQGSLVLQVIPAHLVKLGCRENVME